MESPAGAGQVCDRCRLKKVKCDGAVPTCRNCASAQAACVVSAKLRRRTKIRGYPTPAEDQVKKLQSENDDLRQALRAERELCSSLRHHVEELSSVSTGILGFRSDHQSPAMNVRPPSVTTEPPGAVSNKPGPVIKHMGRLVPDSVGGERFAGSTSGVHFILSVQQTLQNRCIRQQPFPESCFCLHLLEPHRNSTELLNTAGLDNNLPHMFIQTPKQYFSLPLIFYTRQIGAFIDKWGAFCPVVARSDLSRFLTQLLSDDGPSPKDSLNEQLSWLFQVCIILLLNCASNDTEIQSDYEAAYVQLLRILVPRLVAKGDMSSLQALIMFSLYLQVKGQILLMAQMNGILVRLAQSLGLHRHSRRFKFVQGQVEMRKRMWWWVYMHDKITSVAQGLPKLINDVDVDVDYPLDCELDEVNTTTLSFPLPGESTQVSLFTTYVHLGRILSETLGELYTTTRRRRGAEKIHKLDSDLLSWEQRFGSRLAGQSSQLSITEEHSSMSLWISLVSNVVKIMIHRPALTFDEDVPQFGQSLAACVQASSAILSMLSSREYRSIVLGIIPAGPGLILQCGLMLVFNQLHNQEVHEGANEVSASDRSEELVELAASLLESYTPALSSNSFGQDTLSASLASGLQEAGGLLRSLTVDLRSMARPDLAQMDISPGSGQPLVDPLLPGDFANLEPQIPALDFLNGSGALDSLNQLGYLDWIFDGGLVDTGPPLG